MKEKILSKIGSISGITSVLGSWQVCHNACLGLIAVLSLVGITLTGMPLLFFTKIALPFWIAAVTLLLITLYMYYRNRCISPNMIMMNSGLIIAGTPFYQDFIVWIIGGVIFGIALIKIIIEKVKK